MRNAQRTWCPADGYTEHSVEQRLSHCLSGLALGYEDLNDHDQWRRDPPQAVPCGPLGLSLWRLAEFVSSLEPAATYQQAIEKFRAIEQAEAALPLCPEGRSRLLTQGHKTPRVFVLWPGQLPGAIHGPGMPPGERHPASRPLRGIP